MLIQFSPILQSLFEGVKFKAAHPITCLNPEEWFEAYELKTDLDDPRIVHIRGVNTCWWNLDALTMVKKQS